MGSLSTEIVGLLYKLLPGFLAAWIFFGLTAHPRKEPFERIAQALIFMGFIQAITYGLREVLLLAGTFWPLAYWTDEGHFVSSMVIALPFGLIISGCANNNFIHKFLWSRRWNFTKRSRDSQQSGWIWTKRTAYPSEWFSAFVQTEQYVVLHLKGARRLYGWPEEWPDYCHTGHFVMTDIEWVLDDNQTCPIAQTSKLLIPATEVEMVEFMQIPDGDLKEVAKSERKLVELQRSVKENGEQVSATVAQSSSDDRA